MTKDLFREGEAQVWQMQRDTQNTNGRETVSQNLETSQDPWDEIPFGTDADEMAPEEDAAVLASIADRAYCR